MQIHELNNFTGTLGSGAYLAIDDGNDTGKISSQGLLAATEARIDNIIAGPAPSAEEIVDARLGDDGVTYPSLGDAIRDQFSDVKSELTDETNARILLAGRMTTAEGDIDTLETHKVAQPLDEYNQPTDGTDGQLLRTKGDGSTEWANIGLPTDAQTAEAVSDWLDEHPEATTTVQDGSLTEAKFSDALKLRAIKDYVTPEMFGAKGDGTTDDADALQRMFNHGGCFLLKEGATYAVGSGLYLYSDSILCGNNAKLKALDYITLVSIPTMNHDIVIEDLNFEGISSFDDDETSIGLEIRRTNANSVEYEDAYNITIRRCSFDKGMCGIVASKATMINIDCCSFSDFCVHPVESVGGYGIILQSCYRVFITHCRFFKKRYGRHEVYMSELPLEDDYTHNYCKDIHITDCYIDDSEAIRTLPEGIDADRGTTTPISLRNPSNVYIENNYVYGATCLFRANYQHKPCENIVIKGNIIDSPVFMSYADYPWESRVIFNMGGTVPENISTWSILNNTVINCDNYSVGLILDLRYGKLIMRDNRIYGTGNCKVDFYAPCEALVDGLYSEMGGDYFINLRSIDDQDTYQITGHIKNVLSAATKVFKWNNNNISVSKSFFESEELTVYNVTTTEKTVAIDTPISNFKALLCTYFVRNGGTLGTIAIPVSQLTADSSTKAWQIRRTDASTEYATVTYVDEHTIKLVTTDSGNRFVSVIGVP